MTWTKLGDEFPDAAADLSDSAFRLHVEALCWSNRRLLDLEVPKVDLRRFYFGSLDDADLYVNELVGAGWWAERESVWCIGLRFGEWQRDRAQVERKREMDTLAQRRRRKHQVGDHELCLPGRCTALSGADSGADSGDESRAGSGHDPGRDGTGRVKGGLLKENLPEDLRSEQQREEDRKRDRVFGSVRGVA